MYLIAVGFVLCFRCLFAIDDYLLTHNAEKFNVLQDESEMAVGGQIQLTEPESVANNTIMTWKYKEIDEGFDNPQYFSFSKHYFKYKDEIANSTLYQIIRKMPKGAALHVHSSLMLGADYLMKLTYHENLYVCFSSGDMELLFANDTPQRPCSSKWQLMNEARKTSGDVHAFDAILRSRFTLFTEDPNEIDADINSVWQRFNKVYRYISAMLRCRPIREKAFYEALNNFHKDNVMYVEIRSGLHPLYELDGSQHDQIYSARLYQRVAERFVRGHPDFIGVKLIFTTHRAKDVHEIRKAVELAKRLKREMPAFFAGFDLVGQEDLGRALTEFVPVLAEARNELDYFFHAGETNWSGTTSDENLLDAVLLGAKRIGHGYALLKHPTLIEKIKKDNIAIEVNVVSNGVLSLVRDLRNHPLAAFLALGLPVVLSSDDPGIWEAEPLSHDFYIAFVGIASRRADLRTLKQLALNSIEYSAMSETQKAIALQVFNTKWDSFINKLVRQCINM